MSLLPDALPIVSGSTSRASGTDGPAEVMTDVETDVAAIAAWLSNNGTGLAEGAIFYYHGGQLIGLPISGSAGKFLISNGTDPLWGVGLANPMTTAGDMIIGGSGGAPERVGIGTNGYVWTVVSGVPAWAVASSPGLTGENPAAWTGSKTITGSYNGEALLVGANGAVLAFDAPTAASQVLFISVDSGGFTWSVSTGSTAIWASDSLPSYTQTSGTPDVIIAVPRKDLGVWALFISAAEVLGYLPIQEAVLSNAGVSGNLSLTLPSTADTIQVYGQIGNWTIVNPTSYPPAGSSVSFTVRIVNAGFTTTFPTTNTRWSGGLSAAGSAPTLPASGVYDFVVKCLDGVHWDWAFVGRFL
jgi:hypothetical protein